MISPSCQSQLNRNKKRVLSLTVKSGTYLIVPGVVAVIWQISAVMVNQPWIFPTPLSVLNVLIHPLQDILSSGSLLSNTLASLLRVLIGFSVAAITGVFSGLLIGSTTWLRTLFTPIIEILRPLCPIAWMPFAIAIFKMRTLPQIFGIDYSETIFDEVQVGMVFVLFWGAFFPIFTNTCDGIMGVRKNYITLAETLGASKKTVMFRVFLPAALPMILTGLRLGLSLSWFVLIAAEMLPGTTSGIGYLLFYASELAEMNVVIACMLIISVIGAALNGLTLLLMKKFVSWHGKEV